MISYLFKVLLLFLLAFFLATAGFAGVLVAWEPQAADLHPDGWVLGEPITTGQHQDYVLVRYALPDRIQRLAFLQQMRATPGVVFAELDTPVQMQSDWPVYFPLLDFDTSVPLPSRSCYDVPIALIDSGVDRSHPLFTSGHVVFWDDKNYISTGAAQDDSGHGTHIAGLMFASQNASQRVAGICSHGQLLSIRFLGSGGGGSISHAVEGIYHALNSGSRVINTSWVVGSNSQSLADAVSAANQQGVLLVAAAGNSGRSLDTTPSYPASYGVKQPLVVGVANINNNNSLHTGAGASNYGVHSVDLAAPGVSLRSTWLNGGYAYQTGASMSAPLVSAAMAATWHRFPTESAAAIKAALLNSLSPSTALQGKLRYPGSLNVHRLLQDSPQNLFKPVWFNYAWQEYADVLEFQGYLLDQVHQVQWTSDNSDNSELLYLTHRVNEAGHLLVDLPLGWEAGGKLALTAAGDFLQPVIINDVTTLPPTFTSPDQQEPDSQPQEPDSQPRSFNWDGTGVQLQRNYGSGSWEAATVVMDNTQVLKVSGSDLSAEWVFSFSGHPRLRLYDLYARSADGWQKLDTEDGWSLSDVREGKLVISTADDLSWVQKEVQHGVETQVMVLSAHTGVPAADSSRCFIASQVYGANDAPQVQVLRQFRDEVLLTSPVGHALVGFYYRHSPGWVEWMQDKPRLTAVIRWLLDGVVGLISLLQGSSKHG